jgi:hypothetical protein
LAKRAALYNFRKHSKAGEKRKAMTGVEYHVATAGAVRGDDMEDI